MKSLFLSCLIAWGCGAVAVADSLPASPLVHLDSEWWSVADNPDLGALTGDNQQPVDFALWQAADGTWQLWSCLRHTKCGGHTRLLYRWEGRRLTDADWEPKGIAMQADPALGEADGGLQAPHVFKVGDVFHMIYGDWNRICLATSRDGKHFERVLNERGQPDLFTGPYDNSRDPMVLKIGGLFHCYYMGHKKGAAYQSAVFCRTSHDLRVWSEPVMVAAGGVAATQTNWFGGDAECPFVVARDGVFHLFRTQVYGENHQSTLYVSPNPLAFGVGDDRFRRQTLAVAAPEIIEHDGETYLAALKPDLQGIRLTRLRWEK